MTSQMYLGWDNGELRWLGNPEGVARYGELTGASSLVVWRIDTIRERVERVLAHRVEDTWSLIAGTGQVIVTVAVDAATSPGVLEVIDRLSTAGPVIVDRVAPDAWPPGDDDSDSYQRWGFMHPHLGDDGQWHAAFCPELIAEQLGAVTDDDARAHYLNGMYLRILMHVEHAGLGVDEAERRVDLLMYELNPDVLNLVSAVQMHALDHNEPT